MNEIQICNFNYEQSTIRGGKDPDGTPWVIGVDVGRALGYKNPQKAIRDHVDDEDKDWVNVSFSEAGERRLIKIYEPGIYSLIANSHLPAAKQFKRWVFAEVLPSIRKTGTYTIGQALGLSSNGQSDQFPVIRAEGKVARRGLTDVLKEHGATRSYHYINFTNAEYKNSFGMTAAEYRRFKGLGKGENIRDNMTDLESMICRDMEILGTAVIRSENPYGYQELKEVAIRIGNFGGQVRQLAEAELKNSIVSPLNKKDFAAAALKDKDDTQMVLPM